MISFIKYITTRRFDSWDEDPRSAYDALTLPQRAEFLLGQACIINYLDRMYGIDPNPFLTYYRNYVRLLAKLLYQDAKALRSDIGEDIMYSVDNAETLLNPLPGEYGAPLADKVDQAHIVETLFGQDASKEIPMPVVPAFLIPYLHFINCQVRRRLDDSTYVLESYRFAYGEPALLPAIQMNGQLLRVEYNCGANRVLTFELDPGVLNNQLYRPYPILQWFGCFRWNGWSIAEILGCLAAMNISGDEADTKSPCSQLLYALYCRVFGWKPAFTTEVVLNHMMRNAIKGFILELYNRDGISMSDRSILANILGCGTDEERKLAAYFASADATVISQEAYQAFKTSEWKDVKELDITFQNTAAEEDTDPDTTKDQTSEEGDTDPNQDEISQTEEGTGEEGEEDPNEDIGRAEGIDGDTTTPELPGDDETTEGTGEPGTGENDTHTQTLPPPVTDDKRGIKLAFASLDDETPDSIMFRLEMEALIDSILTNPPKNMTPQRVQLLSMIKSRLLYLLHISSLRDVVAIATKLPVAFKKFKSLE